MPSKDRDVRERERERRHLKIDERKGEKCVIQREMRERESTLLLLVTQEKGDPYSLVMGMVFWVKIHYISSEKCIYRNMLEFPVTCLNIKTSKVGTPQKIIKLRRGKIFCVLLLRTNPMEMG